jgi:serine/threonine protein kinase
MEINFPPKKGVGLQKFLPNNCPPDLKDILFKLLTYDPNLRITAEDALKH